MKKILSALLMAAMVLSVAGCNTSGRSKETYHDKEITTNITFDDITDNEPIYPNALLTTKLSIKIWNDIKHQMEYYLDNNSYTYYTDTDIWNIYKEKTLENEPEYAELTDLEFWNIIEKGYISTYTFQANGYASTLHSMFNRYISNSGSHIFNVDSVESFDIIIKDGIWECKQFPAFSKNDLTGTFNGYDGAVKVYYKNNECVAVTYIEGKEEIIDTEQDYAPVFADSGSFEYFYWISDNGQVNGYNEIVGIYPPPLH
mgnify:CR=1 FL=1